jgi:hypothetical protein
LGVSPGPAGCLVRSGLHDLGRTGRICLGQPGPALRFRTLPARSCQPLHPTVLWHISSGLVSGGLCRSRRPGPASRCRSFNGAGEAGVEVLLLAQAVGQPGHLLVSRGAEPMDFLPFRRHSRLLGFLGQGALGSCPNARLVLLVRHVHPATRRQGLGCTTPGERLEIWYARRIRSIALPRRQKIRGCGGVEGPIGARGRRRGLACPPPLESRF